ITDHAEQGGLRSTPLPSAEMDAAGTVYVVWSDCRFRVNCTANDLVLSKSSDGVTWSMPARIPVDPTTSTIDHFIPGLGVDPGTSGSSAHLGLAYYYYPTSMRHGLQHGCGIHFLRRWREHQELAHPTSR